MAPEPIVGATSSLARIEPGEALDITVTVASQWDAAVAAGFLVMTEAGAGVFTASEEGTGNVGNTDGQTLAYAIGHTRARPLADGVATFHATWTAPANVGAYEFTVFGVTSDDGDGADDPDIAEESNEPFSRFKFTVAVGCDVLAYFPDADGDGYGADQGVVADCEAPVGYVARGGDCRDDDAAIHPGAQELCSFVDEDCDGEAMAPPTYYRDADGDGYGAASEISVDSCALPAGYAAEAGDCELTDAAVHPGAVELPGNVVDDDCDGQVDEVTEDVTGANGESTDPNATRDSSAPSTSGAPSAPALPPTERAPSNTAPSSAPDVATIPSSSGSAAGCHVALRQDALAGASMRGVWALTLLVAVCCMRRRS